MNKAYGEILRVLEENLGVVVLEKDDEDISLTDYISDSMMFMQFIIALEEHFCIELPDDFLDAELMNSLVGFSEKLDDFLSK